MKSVTSVVSVNKKKLLEENFTFFLVFLVSSVLITLIMTSYFWGLIENLIRQHPFSAGSVAPYTLRAPQEFKVEDTRATFINRKKATENVAKIFLFDDLKGIEPDIVLSGISDTIKGLAEKKLSNGNYWLSSESKKKLERRVRINIEGDEWNVILNPRQWSELKETVSPLSHKIMAQGIAADKDALKSVWNKGGVKLKRLSDSTQFELREPGEILSVSEAYENYLNAYLRFGSNKSSTFNSLVSKLGKIIIKPNIYFDQAETNYWLKQARESVRPVYSVVHRGDVIARAGVVIDRQQVETIKALQGLRNSRHIFRSLLGYITITLLLIILIYLFAKNLWQDFKPGTKDLSVIFLTLIGSFAILRVFGVIGNAMTLSYEQFATSSIWYLAPLAAGGILLQVTMGAVGVFLFAVTFALLSGVFVSGVFADHVVLLPVFILMSNFAGSICVKECARRSVFVVAGLRVALINAVTILCFFAIDYQTSSVNSLFTLGLDLVCGIGGGITSGLLAASLTPIAEYLGSYLSNIKLLELASLDRPLLRELSVRAPGTWNHSMIIGQLGEVAADSIGANGLLTRVGAYYHDIGKIKKPEYFTENQSGKENKHDKLTPSMSALIIKSHVKDGIELAKQHRLPPALIRFIPEHHGTSLIKFFYEKAKQDADNGESVEEEHYRYGGPKPQTKEAAILMLADGVEASSRTLSDPTHAKIQGLVQKMINNVFVSGELDESSLTLKDLHLVARSFTRVLTGIYHRRIEYPESAEKGKTDTVQEDVRKQKEDRRVSDIVNYKDTSNKGKPGLEVLGKAEQKGVGINGSRTSVKRADKGEPKEKKSTSKKDSDGSGDTLKRLGI